MEDGCTVLNKAAYTPLDADKTMCIAQRMVRMLRDISVCNGNACMLPISRQNLQVTGRGYTTYLAFGRA
jgi:hypothetical protein